MNNKKNIHIIVTLLLVGLAFYLVFPYKPSLDHIDKLLIDIHAPEETRELTGREKKQMYDILAKIKVRRFSLYIFPHPPHNHEDYYAIFVSGNHLYNLINLFPYGDSLNGRRRYGYIKRNWGPDNSFVLKQLIVNIDEFIKELEAHNFI